MNRMLDALIDEALGVILARQHPASGLFPASSATLAHGDYSHAWVRDNVYTLMGPWACARVLARAVPDDPRREVLENGCVKALRGLLRAMMGQADKVERFKATEHPLDALHAKYDAETGKPVARDDAWGHLQLDATALFLLQLAQTTAGGLQVIYAADEIDFVQNLVHYIGPAYRTPDYGIWERGDKRNHGVLEINASSVGLVKAALEAMDGLDLLGPSGDDTGRGVIAVVPDEIARARETLTILLPQESASKETDAALLAVLSYPAFAIEDETLAERTQARITGKLEGRYGAKRFLRDGHQTVVEDAARLHYRSGELGRFADIESEWPLFFTYRLIDAVLAGEATSADLYAEKLDALAVTRDGRRLLPELYVVPPERIEAEIAAPGSQDRAPNANIPLYWAQSLWIVGRLLHGAHAEPDDVDPLGRRLRLGATVGGAAHVLLIAETPEAAAALAAIGAPAVTRTEAADAGVEIRPAADLVAEVATRGANAQLGLSGRPPRRLGALSTATVRRAGERALVFTSGAFDAPAGAARFDPDALAARLAGQAAYVARHWIGRGPAVITAPIAEASGAVVDLLADAMRTGAFGPTPIKFVGPTFVAAAAKDAPDVGDAFGRPPAATPPDPAPPSTDLAPLTAPTDVDRARVAAACDAGGLLALFDGAGGDPADAGLAAEAARAFLCAYPDHPDAARARDLVRAAAVRAARAGAWGFARRLDAAAGAGEAGGLEGAKELLVRLRRLDLAPPGAPPASRARPLARPIPRDALAAAFAAIGAGDPAAAAVAEETLATLGHLIRAEPELFVGVRTIRLADWIALLDTTPDDDPPCPIVEAAPSRLWTRARDVLASTPGIRDVLEQPAVAGRIADWAAWRRRLGVLGRTREDFVARMWMVFHRCDGLIVGSPLEAASRLDAGVLRADHTPAERELAHILDDRLSAIPDPAYRAVTLEALNALGRVIEADPAWRRPGDVVLDAVIHHMVAEIAPFAGDAAWAAAFARPPADIARLLESGFRAMGPRVEA